MHKDFDAEEFSSMDKCLICFEDYAENDQITPLPCHKQHYFHTGCIETWLVESPLCPMCKKSVDMQALVAQREAEEA